MMKGMNEDSPFLRSRSGWGRLGHPVCPCHLFQDCRRGSNLRHRVGGCGDEDEGKRLGLKQVSGEAT